MGLLKKYKFKIIYFFGILFICIAIIFLGIEVCFRFNFYRISRYNKLAIADREDKARLSEIFTSSLWEKPWYEYKKNIEFKKRIGSLEFQIKMNSYGFRTNEVGIPKPNDKYRIVCIGGSTTAEGLTNDTTYPALLEKKLNNYFSSDRIEVLNCGISGLNSFGEKEKMLIYLQMKPDLLLEYNVINDIFWVLMQQWLHNRPLWKRVLSRSLFLAYKFSQFLIVSEKDVKESFNSYTISNLKEIYKMASKNNIKVVFCSFAIPDISKLSKEDIEYLDYDVRTSWKGEVDFKTYARYVRIYNECLEQMCIENDILFIPLAEYLSGGTDYFRDICHLRLKGIEEKTSIIFEYIKDYPERNRLL